LCNFENIKRTSNESGCQSVGASEYSSLNLVFW